MEYREIKENDISRMVQETLSLVRESRIVLLEGDLGSGKTSLIKEYGKALEVEDEINSPTFGYVNEYSTETGKVIYHFDLYRLDNPDELLEIDFESYLDEDALIFIEWPNLVMDFVEDYLLIKIDKDSDARTYYFYMPNRDE